MTQNNKNQESAEQVVENATVESVKFIEKHKKSLLTGTIVVVLIVIAFFAYDKFYSVPKSEEALAQTFTAEQYFRADSFALALNGDGNSLGFEEIIKTYGKRAGEAVYMYAGVSALRLKEYEKAIGFLNKYNGKDPIMKARSISNIGDCYAGLANFAEAAKYYEKAARYSDNQFAANYFLKAGIMYEELGQKDKAIAMYEIIKNKYPQTEEGYQINKYIERIKVSK